MSYRSDSFPEGGQYLNTVIMSGVINFLNCHWPRRTVLGCGDLFPEGSISSEVIVFRGIPTLICIGTVVGDQYPYFVIVSYGKSIQI